MFWKTVADTVTDTNQLMKPRFANIRCLKHHAECKRDRTTQQLPLQRLSYTVPPPPPPLMPIVPHFHEIIFKLHDSDGSLLVKSNLQNVSIAPFWVTKEYGSAFCVSLCQTSCTELYSQFRYSWMFSAGVVLALPVISNFLSPRGEGGDTSVTTSYYLHQQALPQQPPLQHKHSQYFSNQTGLFPVITSASARQVLPGSLFPWLQAPHFWCLFRPGKSSKRGLAKNNDKNKHISWRLWSAQKYINNTN